MSLHPNPTAPLTPLYPKSPVGETPVAAKTHLLRHAGFGPLGGLGVGCGRLGLDSVTARHIELGLTNTETARYMSLYGGQSVHMGIGASFHMM